MLGATSTWLWLVLLCKCSHAALAPLYGWTIDDSCQPYVDSLTDAFGNAAELTRVALEKLEIIRKIRPPPAESYGHDQWGNIDQNLQLAFGFENNEDTEYNSDLDPYWSNIYELFDAINESFEDGQVQPVGGFMYLPGGPTIFCDSRSWVWLTLDDEDPTDVNKGLLKDTKLGQWELPNAIGAWYYQGRFIPEEEKSDVFPLCADDNQASASMKLDAIQICFDGHATAAVTPPNNLGGGESLALIRDNLAFLLVHEFAHWYSTNQLDVKATDVIDEACVDINGDVLHVDPNDPDSKEMKAYGPYCVFNLAEFYPDLAITNADSYALFALMVSNQLNVHDRAMEKYDGISWFTSSAVDYAGTQ